MRDDKIELLDGEITGLGVEAVVNAANNSLLGGGGVDGAIHRAAGPGLLAECRTLGGCPTGEARITGGHNLLARWVIHTVGPVWHGGQKGEAELLAGCYRGCFALIREHHIRSVAFPAVSTGVYGYPREEAARIAIGEIRRALAENPAIERVVLVCFNRDTRQAYEKALAAGA